MSRHSWNSLVSIRYLSTKQVPTLQGELLPRQWGSASRHQLEPQMRTITQHEIGDPNVLQIVETEPPVPAATEVLVEVHATSVNPVDVAVRAGTFPLLGEPPFVLGWDVSGVVVESLPRSSARF